MEQKRMSPNRLSKLDTRDQNQKTRNIGMCGQIKKPIEINWGLIVNEWRQKLK
jgi:hypothetical protein